MKEKGIFRFRQFSVRHDRVSMKVGTDSVLLGAWADVSGAKRILDVGSGSGLIALLLAQRTSPDVRIDAVELSHDDYVQGKENIEASPWAARMQSFHIAIQKFTAEHLYDLIVTNPPYFNNSLQSPDNKRTAVRHAVTLTFKEILASANRLISPTGKLAVILPPEEANRFLSVAIEFNLHCVRKTMVRTGMRKTIERVIFELSAFPFRYAQKELILFDEQRRPSDDYRRLVKPFYLEI